MFSTQISRTTPLAVIAAAALAVGVIGCSSTPAPAPKAGGMEPVDTRMTAISAIDRTQNDIKTADAQIKVNQASLHALIDQQYGDLRPTYNAFAQNVAKTEALGNQLNQNASQVRAKSYEYVVNWDYRAREIQDPSMRDASLARQDQAQKDQEKVVTQMNTLHGAYYKYLQSLRDAQAFAANDLTPDGMKALRTHAATVNDNAKALRETLAQIDGKLTTLADAWRTDVSEPAEWGGGPKATPAGGMMPADSPTTAPSR